MSDKVTLAEYLNNLVELASDLNQRVNINSLLSMVHVVFGSVQNIQNVELGKFEYHRMVLLDNRYLKMRVKCPS